MRTELRGSNQIKNYSVTRAKLALNFLEGLDLDLTNGALNATVTGLRDGTQPSDAATYGQLYALEQALANGLKYMGVYNVTTNTPDLVAGAHKKGEFYKVQGAGTFLGYDISNGDQLIINKDVSAGTLSAADVDVIDNTESADLLRLADIVDNLTSTASNKVLSAKQGSVLKGLIDALYAASWIPVYGEALVVTNGSPTLPALINIPKAGTVRLHMNGLRLEEGAGNDFTVNNSTGVITMEYTLASGDKIVVDYDR